MSNYQKINHALIKPRLGFTLIEILFVIALIGVITAFSLSAYQKKAENTKIDKTALQIQQLLQAGTAYYNDNGCWPNDENPSCPASNFGDYLPFGTTSIDNPWGQPYNYRPTSTKNLFEVTTVAPNTAIAKRIISRLPFSQIHNTRTVKTEITRPGGQGGETSNFMIKTIGRTSSMNDRSSSSNDERTVNFTCPSNWQPGIIATPHRIKSNNARGFGSVILSELRVYRSCYENGPENHYQCKLTVKFETKSTEDSHTTSAGQVSLTYIGYCVKNL